MIEQPTVFIVDDDKAVRESLLWLLESISLNVKTYVSAEDFLNTHTIYQTGCLLLDIRMPGMSGLQLQQHINQHHFTLPIIIITGHGDVPMTVTAMKNGALDFIEKPFNDQDLLEKIQHALLLDKTLQCKRLEYHSIKARIANLTPRETEVLELIASEHSNKQIAKKLCLSIKTIESHRAHLMEKMHANSLIHLLKMLRQNKIIFH